MAPRVSLKADILRKLRNTKVHISGQELCDDLGVSRTAVWKVIKQLEEEGYDIEAVTNKGYLLLGYPEILSGSELMSRMNTMWAGRKVYFHKETESTNEDAKYLAEEGMDHGSLVVSDCRPEEREDAAGRGQSPAGRAFILPCS